MPARTTWNTAFDIHRVADDGSLGANVLLAYWGNSTTNPDYAALSGYGRSELVGTPGAHQFIIRMPIPGANMLGTGTMPTPYGPSAYSEYLNSAPLFALKGSVDNVLFYWGTLGKLPTNGRILPEIQNVAVVTNPGVTSDAIRFLEFHVALYANPNYHPTKLGATAQIAIRPLDANAVAIGSPEVVIRAGSYQQFTGRAKSPGDYVLADLPPGLRTSFDVYKVDDNGSLGAIVESGSWGNSTLDESHAAVAVVGKSDLVGKPGALEFVVRAPVPGAGMVGTAVADLIQTPNYGSTINSPPKFAFIASATGVEFYWGTLDRPLEDNAQTPEIQSLPVVAYPGVTSAATSIELHFALYAQSGYSDSLLGATAEIAVRALDADGVAIGVSEVVYRDGSYEQFTGDEKSPGDLVLVSMPRTMGSHTASHSVLSCHTLEVHRRLILSNDDDASDAAYQHVANKATFEISDGASRNGHSGFMSAYHNGTRPQVELTGDVTFAADSTITLPRGLFHENANGSGSTGLDVSQLLSTISELTATVNDLKSRAPVYVNLRWVNNQTGIIYTDDKIQFKWDGSNHQLMFLALDIREEEILTGGVSVWRGGDEKRTNSYIISGSITEVFAYFTDPVTSSVNHNPEFDLKNWFTRALYYITPYYDYDDDPFPSYEITVLTGHSNHNRSFSIRRIN